eukprot:scaffold19352_cov66-Phaeocystis_antarctica.AAC.4
MVRSSARIFTGSARDSSPTFRAATENVVRVNPFQARCAGQGVRGSRDPSVWASALKVWLLMSFLSKACAHVYYGHAGVTKRCRTTSVHVNVAVRRAMSSTTEVRSVLRRAGSRSEENGSPATGV